MQTSLLDHMLQKYESQLLFKNLSYKQVTLQKHHSQVVVSSFRANGKRKSFFPPLERHLCVKCHRDTIPMTLLYRLKSLYIQPCMEQLHRCTFFYSIW